MLRQTLKEIEEYASTFIWDWQEEVTLNKFPLFLFQCYEERKDYLLNRYGVQQIKFSRR
jgi:hypothetical protein